MKNVTKSFAAAFVIGVFCTLNLIAQGNEKSVSPVKGVGVVIKHGGASRVTFCWSTDENTAANYRLKVWQLMQGQTGVTAMRTNPPIVIKDVDNIAGPTTTAKHAINTKGAGGVSRSLVTETDPEVIKACSESIGPTDSQAAKAQKTKTKSNNANDRVIGNALAITATTIENFPVCAVGTKCDFLWTLEPFSSDAKTAALSAISSIPFNFSIGTDGKIVLNNEK